jgi:hypothetical protein
VLHQGKHAGMRTGEGKTLVATLPIYLNALAGKGVQLVTVNDYLARRDANWMSPVYNALGLTVGVVVPGMKPDVKRAAYAADIRATSLGQEFAAGDLFGVLDGTGPSARVTALWAGTSCNFRRRAAGDAIPARCPPLSGARGSAVIHDLRAPCCLCFR